MYSQPRPCPVRQLVTAARPSMRPARCRAAGSANPNLPVSPAPSRPVEYPRPLNAYGPTLSRGDVPSTYYTGQFLQGTMNVHLDERGGLSSCGRRFHDGRAFDLDKSKHLGLRRPQMRD